MTEPELNTKIGEAVLRIHVITGWAIPSDKVYLQILTEEIRNLLSESFSDLNFQEVIFAFRQSKAQDYGKNMNLDLIRTVLSEYRKKREEVSAKEETAVKPPEKRYTDEELKNIQRQDIENFYQRFRKGSVEEVPEYFEEVLKSDKLFQILGGETVGHFFSLCLSKGVVNLYQKC